MSRLTGVAALEVFVLVRETKRCVSHLVKGDLSRARVRGKGRY